MNYLHFVFYNVLLFYITFVESSSSDNHEYKAKSKMKVAIIGAGCTGLVSAKYCLENNLQCDVFEQTENIGGVWYYTDRVGVDEHGIPIHTVMYKDLRTNLPKELMNFVDFPYPNQTKSYITQQEVLEYLHRYVDTFNLKPHIKFHKKVVNVEPLVKDRWKLTIEDTKTKDITMLKYDAVMVCNGHSHKIHMPRISGMDTFKGKQIHSNVYRQSEPFTNLKVLVIGAGPSGIDIASKVSTVAKKVILSHRSKLPVTLSNTDSDLVINAEKSDMDEASKVSTVTKQEILSNGFKLPVALLGTISIKPVVKKIDGYEITFDDGSKELVDSIIYCTGYEYSFPFLSKECGIQVEKKWVKYVYKHIINVEKPTMGFIGLCLLCCPFPVSDIQARFFLSSLTGKFTLPSRTIMLQDIENNAATNMAKGWRVTDGHKIADNHKIYCEDLANTGHILKIPDVVHHLYFSVRKNRNPNDCFRIVDDEHFEEINC